MLWSLVNGLTLAAATNRIFLHNNMRNCAANELVQNLLNFSALSVVTARLVSPDLSGICKSPMPIMYVHTNPEVFYSGHQHTPGGEFGAALRANWEYNKINFTLTPTPIQGINKTYFLEEHKSDICVGIHSCWSDINTFDVNDIRTKIVTDLKPVNSILETVKEFFFANSLLIDGIFVGAHLRNELRHMESRSTSDSDGCKINMTLIIHQTRVYMHKLNTSIVLLATDNPHGICTKKFTSLFHPILVISNNYAFDSCSEAVFVQEVMGHTSAFIGSAHSSFSQTINDIRFLRYNHTDNKNTILFNNNGVK